MAQAAAQSPEVSLKILGFGHGEILRVLGFGITEKGNIIGMALR
jgi:hypothetical protein